MVCVFASQSQEIFILFKFKCVGSLLNTIIICIINLPWYKCILNLYKNVVFFISSTSTIKTLLHRVRYAKFIEKKILD